MVKRRNLWLVQSLFLYNSDMAQTRQFLVNLIFDPQYRGYVADVPQLPGCMSQGKTVEAALKNVRKAIVVYFKAATQEETAAPTQVLTSQVEVRV
jgi:predicted RNase H-like HicB family nuclease